jgi:pilus assembly protein CpaE
LEANGVSELPRQLKFLAARGRRGAEAAAKPRRVAVVDGAIGPADRVASLAALFPDVTFESAGASWPERPSAGVDILIVPVAALAADEVEAAAGRLKAQRGGAQVVVVLRDADVMTSRRLAHGGAADVLTAPVSESALALSIERLLTREPSDIGAAGQSGEVVVVLKAGGGVGATALAVQTAAMLASRGAGLVCLADLDLQFGAASLYLDLPDAVTVGELLSSGASLDETPFAQALPAHRSGLRILAAPRDLTPLDALSTAQADALLKGLRRDFALTVVDLPSVWTAWTNQVLHAADRIILVTHLSVPHIQLVNRQLRVLAAQNLDTLPITLVCNALSAEQQESLSLRAAARALEHPFDIVIPEDRRTMFAAINQGLELSAVRRGTKIEKLVAELADKVAGGVIALAPARGRR